MFLVCGDANWPPHCQKCQKCQWPADLSHVCKPLTVSTHSLSPSRNPVTSKYKIGESFQPLPSLRITVSAIHTPVELKGALQAVQTAVAAALN